MRNEKNSTSEREVNPLKSLRTRVLVEELTTREGVEVKTAEPYEDLTVTVNGSAVVLIITD